MPLDARFHGTESVLYPTGRRDASDGGEAREILFYATAGQA